MLLRYRHVPCLLALTATLLGCGGEEGGFEKPDVQAGPVETMTLSFVSTLAEDVYIPWPDTQPAFTLTRGGVELTTHRTCIPFCGSGCVCAPCTATSRVRRVSPGETLLVPWDPVHYVVNSCNGSASCSCVESWPVTAGRYSLSLDGFTQAEGGQAIAGQPDVLVGAKPGAESRACVATTEFDLEAKGAAAEARFACP